MRSTSSVKQKLRWSTKNIFICKLISKNTTRSSSLEISQFKVLTKSRQKQLTTHKIIFFSISTKIIKKSEFVRGGRDLYKKRHSRAHKYLAVESAHKFRLRTLNEHVKLLKHNYSFLNNTIITAKAQYLVHSIVKEISCRRVKPARTTLLLNVVLHGQQQESLFFHCLPLLHMLNITIRCS